MAKRAKRSRHSTARCAVRSGTRSHASSPRNNAVAAYAAALCEPVSRAAWTAFVQAVSDFLDELDARIGIAVDHATGKSRRELRDIVSENDDLIVAR
jgi:hypothetical protein